MTDSECVILTEDEYREAARRTLERSGYTYDQLAAMAQRHRFETLGARLAWAVVGHGGDPT